MGLVQSAIGAITTQRPTREDFEKRLASDRDFLQSYIQYLESPFSQITAKPTTSVIKTAGIQPVMSVSAHVPSEYYIEEFNSPDDRARRIAALKAQIATF